MSDYAIFFDYDNKTYRLPTNPEQIETSSIQAIEKYEILKLGQIAIPSYTELEEYNFECEFPHSPIHYIETPNSFKSADYYIKLFKQWRNDLLPVRFIASNGIGDDINILVLIEDITIIEKAGEEGDKYISFKLLEYKLFGKKSVVVKNNNNNTAKTVKEPTVETNPKNSGAYTVVSGDSLWGIAKKYYSDGSLYTKIYNANKDKIKNPSLLQPGMKLVIPK